MIDVPARMAHLDRDRRGLPIGVMVYRDDDGRPHFTINEETVRQRIIANDLCSICGTPLLRGRWFIGGPGSALDPSGAYVDPPVHTECAHYALRVCPYLAAPNYNGYVAARTLKPGDPMVGHTMLDPAIKPDDTRPAVFVAVLARGHRKIDGEVRDTRTGRTVSFVQYLKPHRPYIRVEYWRAGCELTADQAHAILQHQGEPTP